MSMKFYATSVSPKKVGKEAEELFRGGFFLLRSSCKLHS